jgi:hypothetical protein
LANQELEMQNASARMYDKPAPITVYQNCLMCKYGIRKNGLCTNKSCPSNS